MKTEFNELDKLVDINKPQLIVLGARPGMGKTTLSLKIATNIALHQEVPVLYFSLEENLGSLAIDELAERKFGRKLNLENEKIKKAKLFIKDEAPFTIDEILADIDKYVKNENVKFIVIDYLQLIKYDKSKLPNEENEVNEIIKKLKDISNRLEISILITSQLSRKADSRENHRPILTDFVRSKNILETADVIILLYSDYNYESKSINSVELNICKNNNGNIGLIKLKNLL